MSEREVTVGSKVGLHARPASLFVQEAAKQPVAVSIRKKGTDASEAAPAGSILSVLALDARGGDVVILSADGDGAEQALDLLAEFVAKDWDTEEKAE